MLDARTVIRSLPKCFTHIALSDIFPRVHRQMSTEESVLPLVRYLRGNNSFQALRLHQEPNSKLLDSILK